MMKTKSLNLIGAVLAVCAVPFRMTRAANDEAAGNESDVEIANAAGGQAVFELAQDGSFFVPFGRYPHRMGLQVFDRDAANTMVANHNSTISKLKRWAGLQSYPVYIGHPDIPGSKDTDKAAYGWIDSMAVENDGMRFGVKYNDDGQKLVANAKFRFYSPYWAGPKVKGEIRPARLISMGLTNTPNIDVPALANEEGAGGQGPEAGSLESLIELLPESLGLANDASPEAIIEGLTSFRVRAETAEAANATLTADLTTVRGELETAAANLVTLTTERDTAQGELETANELLETLRGSMIDEALSNAITAGRVLPAEKDAKRAELVAANDLSAALGELKALQPKIKVKSVTGDLGGARVQVVAAHNDGSKAAREERAVAVANELEGVPQDKPEGERKQIAWRRAATKNPELFKNQSPGTAA